MSLPNSFAGGTTLFAETENKTKARLPFRVQVKRTEIQPQLIKNQSINTFTVKKSQAREHEPFQDRKRPFQVHVHSEMPNGPKQKERQTFVLGKSHSLTPAPKQDVRFVLQKNPRRVPQRLKSRNSLEVKETDISLFSINKNDLLPTIKSDNPVSLLTEVANVTLVNIAGFIEKCAEGRSKAVTSTEKNYFNWYGQAFATLQKGLKDLVESQLEQMRTKRTNVTDSQTHFDSMRTKIDGLLATDILLTSDSVAHLIKERQRLQTLLTDSTAALWEQATKATNDIASYISTESELLQQEIKKSHQHDLQKDPQLAALIDVAPLSAFSTRAGVRNEFFKTTLELQKQKTLLNDLATELETLTKQTNQDLQASESETNKQMLSREEHIKRLQTRITNLQTERDKETKLSNPEIYRQIADEEERLHESRRTENVQKLFDKLRATTTKEGFLTALKQHLPVELQEKFQPFLTRWSDIDAVYAKLGEKLRSVSPTPVAGSEPDDKLETVLDLDTDLRHTSKMVFELTSELNQLKNSEGKRRQDGEQRKAKIEQMKLQNKNLQSQLADRVHEVSIAAAKYEKALQQETKNLQKEEEDSKLSASDAKIKLKAQNDVLSADNLRLENLIQATKLDDNAQEATIQHNLAETERLRKSNSELQHTIEQLEAKLVKPSAQTPTTDAERSLKERIIMLEEKSKKQKEQAQLLNNDHDSLVVELQALTSDAQNRKKNFKMEQELLTAELESLKDEQKSLNVSRADSSDLHAQTVIKQELSEQLRIKQEQDATLLKVQQTQRVLQADIAKNTQAGSKQKLRTVDSMKTELLQVQNETIDLKQENLKLASEIEVHENRKEQLIAELETVQQQHEKTSYRLQTLEDQNIVLNKVNIQISRTGDKRWRAGLIDGGFAIFQDLKSKLTTFLVDDHRVRQLKKPTEPKHEEIQDLIAKIRNLLYIPPARLVLIIPTEFNEQDLTALGNENWINVAKSEYSGIYRSLREFTAERILEAIWREPNLKAEHARDAVDFLRTMLISLATQVTSRPGDDSTGLLNSGFDRWIKEKFRDRKVLEQTTFELRVVKYLADQSKGTIHIFDNPELPPDTQDAHELARIFEKHYLEQHESTFVNFTRQEFL